MSKVADYSHEFYRRHADEYAEWWSSRNETIGQPSHPGLTKLADLSDRLMEMVPAGSRGLDAGCGPAVKELMRFHYSGYDMVGIDAVKENLQVAAERHPGIKERLLLADIGKPLNFPDAHFNFIICTTVIQHISPEEVMGITLPEFARVLRVGGVLQLMFKSGRGVATVYDKIYNLDRSFQLYEADVLLDRLGRLGMELVPREEGKLGGVMYYIDSKGVDTCIFFARKVG